MAHQPADPTRRTRRIIAIVVPVLTALLGVAIPFFFQKALESAKTEEEIILFSLGILLVGLIVMVVFMSVFLQESQVSRQEVLQARRQQGEMAERVEGFFGTLQKGFGDLGEEHRTIRQRVEKIADSLGLKVHFVKEEQGQNAGETYAETIKLIQAATRRIFIVDNSWVPTRAPSDPPYREAYYDALIKRLEAYRPQPGYKHDFHERIIQLNKPDAHISEEPVVAGTVFKNYALRCLDIAETRGSGYSTFAVAPAYIQGSFFIIDNHVIWLILSANQEKRELERVGAIFIEDTEEGLFINHMVDIFSQTKQRSHTLQRGQLV